MSITLAAVFDDRNDAEQARRRLEAERIDPQQIQITDDTSTITGAATSDAPARRDDDHRPGGLRRFFSELFGTGDDNAGDDNVSHYAEAVRRGSAVLSVNLASNARIDELTAILEDCGAVDIDQRVEQWKADGYTGYDEAAPRYSEPAQNESKAGEVLPVVEEELEVGKRAV